MNLPEWPDYDEPIWEDGFDQSAHATPDARCRIVAHPHSFFQCMKALDTREEIRRMVAANGMTEVDILTEPDASEASRQAIREWLADCL